MYTEEEGMALRRLSSLHSDTGSFPDWIDFSELIFLHFIRIF